MKCTPRISVCLLKQLILRRLCDDCWACIEHKEEEWYEQRRLPEAFKPCEWCHCVKRAGYDPVYADCTVLSLSAGRVFHGRYSVRHRSRQNKKESVPVSGRLYAGRYVRSQLCEHRSGTDSGKGSSQNNPLGRYAGKCDWQGFYPSVYRISGIGRGRI